MKAPLPPERHSPSLEKGQCCSDVQTGKTHRRLISLTTCLIKVFERMILNCLTIWILHKKKKKSMTPTISSSHLETAPQRLCNYKTTSA